MPNSWKIILTCATHLAGLAVGWQGWMLIHGSSDATGQAAPPATSSKHADAGATMPTEDVFAFAERKNSLTDAQQTDAKTQAEFRRLLETMAVPDDLEAAIKAELAEWLKDDEANRKPSPKIMFLMYHWAARDMAGMQKWLEAISKGTGTRF